MLIVPNMLQREALLFGNAVIRGLLDPSAFGSFLKPLFTPGLADLNSLFEHNHGYQNNAPQSKHPTLAQVKAAEAIKKTQPAAAGGNTGAQGGIYPLPTPTKEHAAMSEDDYKHAADQIGVTDVAVIKAVAQVESGGQAFLKDGRPAVRYEPHHFRKFTAKRYDKEFPTLSAPYSTVKKLHLSKGNLAGYKVLTEAMKLDSDAAVESCSWGAFQVMGDCWKDAGFASPHDMVVKVYQGLGAHLQLFVGFIKKNRLAAALKEKEWAKFAKSYNGGDYATHHYDTQLETSYKSFAKPI